MLYVKQFVSFDQLLEELDTNNYAGLLIKVGSDRCPPCVALDKGPLEDLAYMVNEELEKEKKKQLLVLNINLTKVDPSIFFQNLKIENPESIPAFYLFKYEEKTHSLLKVKEERGYNMQNPVKWKSDFSSLIVSKLK